MTMRHRSPLDELLDQAQRTLTRLRESGEGLDRATEQHRAAVEELQQTVEHLKEEHGEDA